MTLSKREREPDEAPEPIYKHHRAQKKLQTPDSDPLLNPRNSDQIEPGRPGIPFFRVSQAGPHHSSSVRLPPKKPGQGARPRPRLRLNPPRPQNQPDLSQAVPTEPGSSRSETSTCYSQKAANYDAEPDADPVGNPKTEDLNSWGSVDGAAEFISSESGLKGNWVGVRPLGKGGNGIAGLWEMRDRDGCLVKEMVIKEETYARSQWKNDESIEKVPLEVKTMSMLNKTRCHAIPRLIKYKRYPLYHKHRMYMEYCPFKDLSVLCERYRRFRQYLPEPFLWDTFYHLVEAAVAMRDAPKGKLEIVHRDIKPCNIFLGVENEAKGFPFYPVAKTGDFGLAVMTKKKDRKNPSEYQGPGTQGYFAPEQLVNDLPKKDRRLSSRTNVWAIGATMLELLTLYTHAEHMNDPAYNVDGVIEQIRTENQPEFSADLRDLIMSCIKPNASDRISLHPLRALITSYRERIHERYNNLSDDDGRAKFEFENLLFYVKDEINNMPTGSWIPYDPEPTPGIEKFPDTWPIKYPRFDKGREGGRGGSEDSEGSDEDSDEDEDSDDDDDDDVGRTRAQEPEPQTAPPHPRDWPVGFSSHDGGARDGSLSDGRRPSTGALLNETCAVSGRAASEDGGMEEREDSLTDRLVDGSSYEGTGDESQDVGSESDYPGSPPRSTHQVSAPQALAADPQPAPRRLRNGKAFAYFEGMDRDLAI